jgi:hypothetical protein
LQANKNYPVDAVASGYYFSDRKRKIFVDGSIGKITADNAVLSLMN